MPSLSRKYDTRVTVQTTQMADDGFGGKVASVPVVKTVRWAKVRPPNDVQVGQYQNLYGLKGDSRVYRFTFRAFEFDMKTDVLMWKSLTWTPLAVETDPNDVETAIIAKAVEDNL